MGLLQKQKPPGAARRRLERSSLISAAGSRRRVLNELPDSHFVSVPSFYQSSVTLSRIIFIPARQGAAVIVVLGGGDKSTQEQDIKIAKALAPLPLARNRLSFLVVAFSSREPESTSLENALAKSL